MSILLGEESLKVIYMSNLINEEVVHVNGIPKKLVVFLHGYIDSAPSLDRKISKLIDGMDNVAIQLPQSPNICEIHDNKRQWYSMHRFDANDDRKTVATMEECAAIYDKMRLGLQEAYDYLALYIDDALNEYGLTYKDLYLCGFSQGATLALYYALMTEQKIGGCATIGGMIAPHSYLVKEYKSTPDMMLIHGDLDNLVRLEALDFTKNHLQSIGCNVEAHIIKDGQHKVTDECLDMMLGFINSRTIKKVAI